MTPRTTKNLLVLACAAAVFASSCKKNEDSETSALTNQNLACFDYSNAQYQQLQKDVSTAPGFFNNFSNNDQQALFKHFQAIPPLYRNELLSLKKKGSFRGIFKRDLGSGGVMGVCSSNNRGPIEIGLTSRHQNAISFAMIHEVGHGMEGFIQRKAGRTNRDWEATLRNLMGEAQAYNRNGGFPRGQQVRDYAFASDAEFFAEAFHNYYCSPDTHAFIEKRLPKTFAFLNSVLEQPVWKKGGATPPPTTPTPPAPEPDEKGEALAEKHVNEVFAAYNARSRNCDLVVQSINRIEADGDFFLDVAAVRKGNQLLPATRLRTNYKLALNSELADLKILVPRVFPGCPGE